MSSSLKDLQCIAVRTDEDRSETTAVVPLTHRVDRLQNYHIFQSIDEPCWQSCAARGRPRLSCREEHRNAPVKLAAALSGPWHRPANYRPPQLDSATSIEYPDRVHTRGTQRKTNELTSSRKSSPLRGRSHASRKAERKDGLYGRQAIRLS